MAATKLPFEKATKTPTETKQEIRFLRNMSITEVLKFGSSVENLKKADDGQKSYMAYVAASHDGVEVIKALHEVGFDLSKSFDNGWSVATSAARTGGVSAIKALGALGIDLAKPDEGLEGERYVGRTPATVAARMEKLNVLEALQEMGIDLRKSDGSGNTPLSIVMKYAEHSKMMGLMYDIERIIKGESSIDKKVAPLTLVPAIPALEA